MSEGARSIVERVVGTHGFHTVRFAAAGPTPRFDAYEAWLEAGHHADMDYLVRGRDIRADPRIRLPGARSVAVLALGHHHRRPPDPGGLTGQVARYAWGRDYHNLVGKRLRKVRRDLAAEGIESWGGVDTAPIVERAWAEAAGIGFSGKNNLQILPARTSWFFLAVLFLSAEIAPDPPITKDHCGRCSRCLDACPTRAFVGPHSLDARRCISYWTIESRELAPRALRPGFGRWMFGCDVCQEVCPHNVRAPDGEEDDLLPRHAWIDLPELLATPDDVVLERYTGTPLRRPGAAGLKRNALIVLGNLGDPDGIPAARIGLTHPSPVVRGAAVWALGRLGDAGVRAHRDDDPLVQDELRALIDAG